MQRHLAGFLGLVACTPTVQGRVDDPEARTQLKAQADEVSRLRLRLADADAKVHEACEFQAGDCLMQLREKRRELVRGRTFLECDSLDDREKRARCEEEKLLERGELDAVERYYDYNVWCLGGMAACIAEREEVVSAEELRAVVQKRRARFFASDLAASLELELVVAEEQLAYVRTTLPPVADAACRSLDEVEACHQRGLAGMTQVEEYLTQAPSEYEQKSAERLLREAKETEAECVRIEQGCLARELEQHGATDSTRALLEQNLGLVEQRTRLQDGADPATVEACLRTGLAPHESYILANYRQYARRPVEYFRLQMHRAFLRVHQAQIDCLEKATK